MIKCFLGDGRFRVLVLEYFFCSMCSAADTHLLDRAVSGARLLTGCVFECDIAQRRSVAALCMLYKIRCNPKSPLYGAQIRVTRCALVAYWYTCASLRCRTSHHCRAFISLSVYLWNDLADTVFDGVRMAGFKGRPNAFFISPSC